MRSSVFFLKTSSLEKLKEAEIGEEMAENRNSSEKNGDISALIRGNHQTQYLLGREAVNG